MWITWITFLSCQRLPSVETYQLVEPSIMDRDVVCKSLTCSSELYVSVILNWKNSRDMQEFYIIHLVGEFVPETLVALSWLL